MKSYDPNDKALAAFLAEHFGGQEPTLVPKTKQLQYRICYGNVRQTILECGGSAQWGWAFLEIPGRMIEAMHHAVWRNPNGELEDVTHSGSIFASEKQTVFIPDDTIPPAAQDPCIPSKFKQLDSSNLIRDWIRGNVRRMELMAEMRDLTEHIPKSVLPDGRVQLFAEPPPLLLAKAAEAERLQANLLAMDVRITALNRR